MRIIEAVVNDNGLLKDMKNHNPKIILKDPIIAMGKWVQILSENPKEKPLYGSINDINPYKAWSDSS